VITQITTIDLAVLTRDQRPLNTTVAESIRNQRGVRLQIHRIIGSPKSDDPHRIATIARARNAAVQQARTPWLMFLDDDVVLAPDCVARLQHALTARTEYAGFGANYLDEATAHCAARHVTMGATMFWTAALQRNPFRWETNKCECLCCCEDLRRTGNRVEYLSGARAWHLRSTQSDSMPSGINATGVSSESSLSSDLDPSLAGKAKILVAFNRRDVRRFRDAFLRTLRASGNQQEVIVVGYGLYPSEVRLLSASPRVRVVHKVVNGHMPPVRRLQDFAEIVASLDPATPVAYWDASDVIFQSSLAPLWQLTQQFDGKLLAVREPKGYPHNAAIVGWTQSIDNPHHSRRAFELFSTRPFLNSGFGAGTAAAMHAYFTEAARLRSSVELSGTTDWGDQSAMNLYCHSDNNRWQEIPQGWNFCVHDRPRGEVHVTSDGRVVSGNQTQITAVHGNARSLRQLAIIH